MWGSQASHPDDVDTARSDQDRILDLYNKGKYTESDRDSRLTDIHNHLNSLPGQ
jgi:hypothetical protein